MKIKELFKNKPVISLEIFPPKPESPVDTIYKTIDGLYDLKPDYISVTYGAGGSSKSHTLKIADIIKNKYNIEALAHLTCINSAKEDVDNVLKELKSYGVENVLALRGDIPLDDEFDINARRDFKYAKDLVSYIKESDDFCIAGACYPEVHIECTDSKEDLKHLKEKVDNGVDFLITQLFFDNNLFYSFKEKADAIGINIPISAGIMPVINKKQIERITSLCGTSIPLKFRRILDKYEHNPEALKEAGIAYATEQIIDLLSYGIDGIHLYTMNKPEISRKIFNQIESIRSYFKEDKEDIIAEAVGS
ncbi:MAG: methylenetetrahydrofolate reductase [NAD(P)H] [Firmicutes bacterium]|nr:methylenetetrahydrofolate reductase [NAD(P)H] [Bacillota bacterium]